MIDPATTSAHQHPRPSTLDVKTVAIKGVRRLTEPADQSSRKISRDPKPELRFDQVGGDNFEDAIRSRSIEEKMIKAIDEGMAIEEAVYETSFTLNQSTSLSLYRDHYGSFDQHACRTISYNSFRGCRSKASATCSQQVDGRQAAPRGA